MKSGGIPAVAVRDLLPMDAERLDQIHHLLNLFDREAFGGIMDTITNYVHL